MTNPYGITLDSEWIEWAAKEKASEAVAAALLLICETRPVHEVVAKLTPGEFERVVDIVRRSPDHFPPGALAALKSRGAMLARRPAADDVSTDQEPRQRPVGTSPKIASERQAHVLRAALPVFALISSVLFLGDRMTPKLIVGGLLAISGVAITQVRPGARPI